MMIDLDKLLARIDDSHNRWCSVLEDWMYVNHPNVSFRRPRWAPESKPNRYLGRYYRKSHLCVYSLPDAVLGPDELEDTIAHECCHAYQWQAMKESKAHGDFFFYLLRYVCGFSKAGRCGPARTKVNRRQYVMVAKLIDVQLKIREM